MADTNLMKRDVGDDVYDKISPKRLQRRVDGFSGWHNNRPKDTVEQMKGLVSNMEGKHLRCAALVAPDRLPNGARS